MASGQIGTLCALHESFCVLLFFYIGTIGDGLIVFPLSVAMHFYGKDNQPSFIPNFMAFVIFAVFTSTITWTSLKGKVCKTKEG